MIPDFFKNNLSLDLKTIQAKIVTISLKLEKCQQEKEILDKKYNDALVAGIALLKRRPLLEEYLRDNPDLDEKEKETVESKIKELKIAEKSNQQPTLDKWFCLRVNVIGQIEMLARQITALQEIEQIKIKIARREIVVPPEPSPAPQPK